MVPGKLQSQAEPEADLSALLAVRQQLPHCGIWVVKSKRIAVGRPSGAGLFVRRTPLNARQGVRVVRKPEGPATRCWSHCWFQLWGGTFAPKSISLFPLSCMGFVSFLKLSDRLPCQIKQRRDELVVGVDLT